MKRTGLSGQLMSEVAPLLAVLEQVNRQIAFLDGVIEELSRRDEAVGRLRTMPSIGPVTAAAFVAALDGDASRFQSAHQVESYLGLVPRERSSGESQRKGSITKAGNGRMRWLLVQAAVSTLRLKKPQTAVLRGWGERIALPINSAPFTQRRWLPDEKEGVTRGNDGFWRSQSWEGEREFLLGRNREPTLRWRPCPSNPPVRRQASPANR